MKIENGKTIRKIEMPEPGLVMEQHLLAGAKVIHVGQQDGELFAWIIVDRSVSEVELRKFTVFGTGWSIPCNGTFLGSVQVGIFVWHIMEIED